MERLKDFPKLIKLADFELGSNSTNMGGESSGYTHTRSRRLGEGRAERVSYRYCSKFFTCVNLLEQHKNL